MISKVGYKIHAGRLLSLGGRVVTDTETYENWKHFTVPGTSPKSTDTYANLTESEQKLLMMLQKDPMHSRLEQEKILVVYVRDAISEPGTSNIK